MVTNGKAVKQVLITINRKNLDEWNLFEAYIKKLGINRSRLIRQLVCQWLRELPMEDTGPIVAGSISD